ncbi:helix-turn-helix domain-containing protein [Hoyosella subflava]|uniref:Putative repressor protein n=1 Tax=Hoyosella subflava (strain DSM 45089 / JCM 17490 / NBRC 109087 / DQS3-9A1) TaxID=443218 RepID=F6ESH3_HOYSD|nr:helix-turn-helix transcriptional regulator [Hoyosella subflava]AEF43094.1 Putative repressor protein [Hoyosella subflava DQS3-9A1]
MSRRVMRGFRGERLREMREACGISQQDLARMADLSAGLIVGRWENGERSPQVDLLARVARVLNKPIEYFVDISPEERFLGDLRILRGLTQPALAARIGISTGSLAELERGQKRLPPEVAQRLAGVLDFPVEAVIAAHEAVRTRPPGTPP